VPIVPPVRVDRKVLIGFVLGAMSVVFARYAQVEAADHHSSPLTREGAPSLWKQLWELPDDKNRPTDE
jgi:hypothetical protein